MSGAEKDGDHGQGKGVLEQNGNKPELFGDIVRAAVALLERLIAKVM